MRLCLQALATLSQAQIHNLVAFLLSKTVSPIPFPPLEINESPGLCHGSQRSCSGKNIGIHTVKVMVQCLPARSGKLERLLCTCRSNSPDIASPRTLLEPVYCETRSVHCPGEIDNWNKYCENASLRQDVLCPTKRALWYHIWLPLNGEMRGQPGVAI
jgi:hypothetical protein